jgi:ribosomal protein S24E
MKRIVRGNDFTMRIPVVKIVDGEKVAFPLPGCTDIVVRLCSAYRRLELAHTIDAKEDNVIVARVEGDRIHFGTYALEVRGKIFGNDWRSNEYEQVAIVDRNADADTELGETDEGEDSVEMDTAVVILPPDRELEALVKEAEETVKTVTALNEQVTVSEEGRAKSEESRVQAELTRVSQEAERVQAEGTRTKTEIGREANELTRKNNEAKRQDNETARQIAEEKRETDTTSAISAMKTKTDSAIASMDEHKAAFDNAEAARAGNEEARVAAETARAEAESERTEQEQARQAAEARRAEAETARAQAEQVRQEAEGKREESNAKFMADCEATMSAAKEYLSEAECVSVQAEDIELEANKYYDITLASTNTLTLTLQATDDTTHAHDYEGGFDTDDNAVPTVTWPEGVQWADMPTLKYGRHYEFNVRDVGGKKYGVVYVWDKE